MRKLLIVGAGGFGRELYGWLRHHPENERTWEIGGFLDDNPAALDAADYPPGIVGGISGHLPETNELFVCGIGQPRLKEGLCQDLVRKSAEFLTFVHPSVLLGPHVRLGKGVVLCPRVTLTTQVAVGDFVVVNCHSSAGHDVRMGAWSTISGHCDLTGHVRLGERVFVGSGARVLPGKSVGDGAVVGAGSVVLRNVPDKARVFGNPARPFA